MRFRNLRISVAISLVVFFLIVGNILIAGSIMKNDLPIQGNTNQIPDQNAAVLPDARRLLPQDTTTIPTTTTTPTAVSQPPAPVITTTRTRAS